MLTNWITHQILTAARALESAGNALYQFEEKLHETLSKLPIQPWEADRLARGLALRLIKENGHFYRVGAGKASTLSLFVRNEEGRNVGLRRESITQMATYVSLVTDYGFGRSRTRFESRWMDVVVDDGAGRPLIYAENKASEKVLRKLCDRLERDFVFGLPDHDPDLNPSDPVMKAQHILTNRPQFFWAVAPTYRRAYTVAYTDDGFGLEATGDIPSVDSAPSSSPGFDI